MAGLVPAIHDFFLAAQDVDARDTGERSYAVLRAAMRGHDDATQTIRRYAAIFTYSKSPGLLSMPMRGGAIQFANWPGSMTLCIRLTM